MLDAVAAVAVSRKVGIADAGGARRKLVWWRGKRGRDTAQHQHHDSDERRELADHWPPPALPRARGRTGSEPLPSRATTPGHRDALPKVPRSRRRVVTVVAGWAAAGSPRLRGGYPHPPGDALTIRPSKS